MLNFPVKTLESIRKILQRQQKEVEKNLKEIEEDDPAKEPALAESSEPGTDSYIADIHTKSIVLIDRLKKTGSNIKVALNKIRLGTYGICEKCKKKIEVSRLLIMPTARHCVACSKKSV